MERSRGLYGKRVPTIDDLNLRTVIRFWGINGQYGPLSNFYPVKIHVDGKDWPSVEHYYQAQKSTDEAIQEFIRQAKTPVEAKRIGLFGIRLRDDWDSIREDVMRKALEAKFTRNRRCRRVLISTGQAVLFEDDSVPTFWSGRGQNKLGLLLMDIRENIKKARGY
jgi:ribA/ribD-fused uncharacterized protein